MKLQICIKDSYSFSIRWTGKQGVDSFSGMLLGSSAVLGSGILAHKLISGLQETFDSLKAPSKIPTFGDLNRRARREFQTLCLKKYSTDLNLSCLKSKTQSEGEREKVIRKAFLLYDFDPSKIDISSKKLYSLIDSETWRGELNKRYFATMYAASPIQIVVMGSDVGVITVLKRVQKVLGTMGIDIDLQFEKSHCIELVNDIAAHGRPEFAIIADASFFARNKRNKLKNYSYVLPIHSDETVLLANSQTMLEEISTLYYVEGTSAHEAYLSRSNMDIGFECVKPLPSIQSLRNKAKNLTKGEAVLAWTTLVADLKSAGVVVQVSNGLYFSKRSLIYNKKKVNIDTFSAFLNIFIAAWKSETHIRNEYISHEMNEVLLPYVLSTGKRPAHGVADII